jgi:hypothetical protein
MHGQIKQKQTGGELHRKGKRGDLSPREYFINISEKYNYGYLFILISQGMGMSHHVAKVSSKGDKCPFLGMQYIFLASVYFGGKSIHFLMCKRGRTN